jgi:hypothetical protein
VNQHAQLYRAYIDVAGRQNAGARITRVALDYELKRDYQRFLQAHNRGQRHASGHPDWTADEVRTWADAHGLHVVDGRDVGRARIRVVSRRSSAGPRAAAHQTLAESHCAAAIRPAVLDEFRWFHQARREIEQTVPYAAGLDRARATAARRAFGSERFFAVYRDWLQRGEVALATLLSHRLHDAWYRGDLRVERCDLPYQYARLSPALEIA